MEPLHVSLSGIEHPITEHRLTKYTKVWWRTANGVEHVVEFKQLEDDGETVVLYHEDNKEAECLISTIDGEETP